MTVVNSRPSIQSSYLIIAILLLLSMLPPWLISICCGIIPSLQVYHVRLHKENVKAHAHVEVHASGYLASTVDARFVLYVARSRLLCSP